MKKSKTKHTAELVAERLTAQLDEKKERAAALIEALTVTGARAGKDVPLQTILEYAAGFYGFMTMPEADLRRTLH